MRARGKAGFTLFEVMVVILVIGLLAGLVAPQIFGRVGEAKTATARTQIELMSVALDNYRLDNGFYPTTQQGLVALRERPSGDPAPVSWRGPYLRRAVPLDPWNRPYQYRSPAQDGSAFELVSLGRDGAPGGDGEDADVAGG